MILFYMTLEMPNFPGKRRTVKYDEKLFYNLGQNIVDKLTKLSELGFSMECFTVNLVQFSSKTIEIFLQGGRLGTCHQFQTFQEFCWNFLIL